MSVKLIAKVELHPSIKKSEEGNDVYDVYVQIDPSAKKEVLLLTFKGIIEAINKMP